MLDGTTGLFNSLSVVWSSNPLFPTFFSYWINQKSNSRNYIALTQLLLQSSDLNQEQFTRFDDKPQGKTCVVGTKSQIFSYILKSEIFHSLLKFMKIWRMDISIHTHYNSENLFQVELNRSFFDISLVSDSIT